MSDAKESKAREIIETIIGIAAIVLAFALPRQKAASVKQNDEEPAHGGDDQQEVSDKHNREPPLPLTTNDNRNGGERKCEIPHCERHGAPPASGWNIFASISQAAFSALLVVVGIGQICVYQRQAGIMDKQAGIMRAQNGITQNQLNEMQAEQRAWISITKDSGVESLSIDSVNNQLDAKLKITLQNTGRNPAVFVSVNAEMSDFAIPHGGSMPDWQAAVCKIDVRTYGFTMFPNSIQPSYEVTVSSKIPTQAVVVPSIAACIIYQDAVTGKTHHSPLAFQLMKTPRPEAPCCGIVIKSLPLQSSEIMTRLWTLGSLPPD